MPHDPVPVAAPLPAKKQCNVCFEWKPVEAFYPLHKDSPHRQGKCKRCDNLVRANGLRIARGVLQAAGAAHQLDLDRERQPSTVAGLRVVKGLPAIHPGEVEGEEWTPPGRPATDDEAEARLFGAIAGAYVLAGVDPAVAWDRANEWLEEHPGELPEGVEPLPPEPKRRGPMPFLTTPAERLREPLENVERFLPREDFPKVLDPHDGLPVVSAATMPPRPEGDADADADADALADRLMAENRPRATTRRSLTPRAPRETTPATAPEKDRTMEQGSIREAVFAALKGGDKTVSEIAEAIGRDAKDVGVCLGRMRAAGLVKKANGYGAPWSLVEGATLEASAGKPAKERKPKKAARKPAKRAKANGTSNGHANGHAAPPAPSTGSTMGDAVAMLKAALTEDFNRKLAALEVLAK